MASSPFPAVVSLPDNKFSSKFEPKVPRRFLENHLSVFFVLFMTVSAVPLISVPWSSKAFIISKISERSLFGMTRVVLLESCIFFWIPVSAAEAASVKPRQVIEHF